MTERPAKFESLPGCNDQLLLTTQKNVSINSHFFTLETSFSKRSGESMCWINVSATQVMNRGRSAADARGGSEVS